jgi:hypothetical protein
MIKDLLETKFKKKGLIIIAFLCVLTSLVLLLCSADSSDSSSGDKEEITVDSTINETAHFLAGREIPKDSTLFEYSKTKEYKSYSKLIEINWDKLQRLNEKKITIWREKHLPETYTRTIFYPFSGPDILNAVIFFPDGNEYIMFGLEPSGDIPRPQNISYDKLQFGLRKLWEALDDVIKVNFFKTIEMKNEISKSSFDSVNSVIMFFLARTDYQVINARKIWMDENGKVTTVKPNTKTNIVIPGSEIVFKKANRTPIKRVFYFQIDISDNSLKKHSNFISYIKSKGRLTTIIKSASYLMHRDKEFSGIRSLILSQSDYLLQDDSGIPLKCFSPKEWKVFFHGNYTKPIDLFANRYQDDLFQAMKKSSSGQLDFSYGYNFKEHNPNLLFVERIKE